MTRTQFLSTLTLPFVSRFFPKEEKKELPWGLKYAKAFYLQSKERHAFDVEKLKARRDYLRKYPYLIEECALFPQREYWTKTENELYQEILK